MGIVNAESGTVQAPVARVLDTLHPARFADLPATLVGQALGCRSGRRFLYRRASLAAPDVFVPERACWSHWLAGSPWLAWPRGELAGFAHVLGVVAMAPALRVILQRDKVLFLRRVAGESPWRVMQRQDPWDGAPPEAVRHLGSALLRRCGDEEDVLRSALLRRGAIEFIGHAERTDALLASRLRLSFVGALPEACAGECWLPTQAVDGLLQEYDAAWKARRADARVAPAADGGEAAP